MVVLMREWFSLGIMLFSHISHQCIYILSIGILKLKLKLKMYLFNSFQIQCNFKLDVQQK